MVSWSEIEKALKNDEKLLKIRNALKNIDMKALNDELIGIKILDNWAEQTDIVKTSSEVKAEDCSLYKNCILVHDHIWVPEDPTQNF